MLLSIIPYKCLLYIFSRFEIHARNIDIYMIINLIIIFTTIRSSTTGCSYALEMFIPVTLTRFKSHQVWISTT